MKDNLRSLMFEEQIDKWDTNNNNYHSVLHSFNTIMENEDNDLEEDLNTDSETFV